jgi:hypothetical protein
MDHDTFQKLAQILHDSHLGASDAAAVFVVPLLLLGIFCGFFLARWIFRGGLSRCALRMDGPRFRNET